MHCKHSDQIGWRPYLYRLPMLLANSRRIYLFRLVLQQKTWMCTLRQCSRSFQSRTQRPIYNLFKQTKTRNKIMSCQLQTQLPDLQSKNNEQNKELSITNATSRFAICWNKQKQTRKTLTQASKNGRKPYLFLHKKFVRVFYAINIFTAIYYFIPTILKMTFVNSTLFRRWLYSHASIAVAFSDLIIMNMLIAGTHGP